MLSPSEMEDFESIILERQDLSPMTSIPSL